jgi:hypothetical protein
MTDPTGTFKLRRSFQAEGNRRLARLRSYTHAILVERDLMAARNDPLAQLMPDPGHRLSAFSEWFGRMSQATLMGEEWWASYLRRAYESGAVAGSKLVNIPIHSLPVPAVYRELAKNEFTGIVGAMHQQVTRQVMSASLGQLKPAMMYRQVLAILLKIGAARMKLAVNTMTVQLHNAARLEQFRAAGITQVGIDPEMLEPRPPSRFLKRDHARDHAHDHKPHLLHDLTAAQELRRAQRVLERQRAEAEEAAAQAEVEVERERAALQRQIEREQSNRRILRQSEATAQAELAAAQAEARAEVARARAATAAAEREASEAWERVKAARAEERRRLYPEPRPEEGPPRVVPEWEPPPGFQRVGPEREFGEPKIPERLKGMGEFVNVLTAGDDKVCQTCQDLAAEGPYSLAEARTLLPAHVNCRCAFIPAPKQDEEDHGWFRRIFR